MINIEIKAMMKAKTAAWDRRITLNELAKATGISRMTLSRMINNKSYSTVTNHLDMLCQFFECELHELIKYVPENQPSTNLSGAV
ncbi:MAG: putative transcriptional regulator [Methylophilaceae bacterium]|jgi:putative transcriptional regulator